MSIGGTNCLVKRHWAASPDLDKRLDLGAKIPMSSSTRKRPKLKVRESSFPILREPSPNLFPSKGEILKLIAVVAIAASVAFGCNYVAAFFNRQPKPFCDSGDVYEDPRSGFCEPCPKSGRCFDGELVCLHGYKKQGRKCVVDGEINQTTKKLSEWVEDHACNAYARVLCDEAGKIWFHEADIVKLLDEHESEGSLGLKGGAFTSTKEKVMETLGRSLEKRASVNGSMEYKCPDMQAELHKPFLCSVRQCIYRNSFFVVTLSVSLLGFIRLLWTLQKKRNLSTRAEQLYEQVCEILEDNAMMAKGKNNDSEPWMVASWLRDHLLLPKERKDGKLWKKVEELLLEDSRIDQYPKLVKGESKIVFEWQVEGSLSSKMRAKRAISKTKPGGLINVPSSYQQREANACL